MELHGFRLCGCGVIMKRFMISLIVLCFLGSAAWATQQKKVIARQNDSHNDYTQDANCMGAWYMNNNGGNEIDRSGENGTLTQNGGTIPTSATVPAGYSGTSRDFESSETEALYHADGKSTDISGADQKMSFCVWLKFEADPGADVFILNKYNAAGDLRQYQMRHIHADNAIEAAISSNGADNTECLGATDLANDTDWHHVCFVYNDVNIILYVDGSVDSNGVNNPKTYSSGIANKSYPFVIGDFAIDGSYKPFDGLLDEAIIFDRDLSLAEITEIYNHGISGNKGGND